MMFFSMLVALWHRFVRFFVDPEFDRYMEEWAEVAEEALKRGPMQG